MTTKRLPSEKAIREMKGYDLRCLALKWFPETFEEDAKGFVEGWTPFRLWKVLRASGWYLGLDYYEDCVPEATDIARSFKHVGAKTVGLYEVAVANLDDPTDDLIRVALLAKRYDLKHGSTT